MKYSKPLAIAATSLLLSATTLPATAEVEISTDTKKTGVVMGSALTGAVVGGPFGAMAGMIAGAWLGEKVETAAQVEGLENRLVMANQLIGQLETDLASATAISETMAQAALDQLQLEFLFKTGDGELTTSGSERLSKLANFLLNNTGMQVRLDGFSDPRGDKDYNLALSKQRVDSVARWLIDKGINPTRIETYSHGASLSAATVGDYDSYAMERSVKIQLSRGSDRVAHITISH